LAGSVLSAVEAPHPPRPRLARRLMRRLSPLSWSLLALAVAAVPRPALAQQAARSGEFTVQSFEPAVGTSNFLTVEGLRMAGGWAWTVGVLGNYARNPFVLQSCISATDCSKKNPGQPGDLAIVSDMLTTDLMAAVSPAKRFQIGLRLPIS